MLLWECQERINQKRPLKVALLREAMQPAAVVAREVIWKPWIPGRWETEKRKSKFCCFTVLPTTNYVWVHPTTLLKVIPLGHPSSNALLLNAQLTLQFNMTNKILMCSSKSDCFLNCSVLGSLIILTPCLLCGNSDIDGKSHIHSRDFLHFFLFLKSYRHCSGNVKVSSWEQGNLIFYSILKSPMWFVSHRWSQRVAFRISVRICSHWLHFKTSRDYCSNVRWFSNHLWLLFWLPINSSFCLFEYFSLLSIFLLKTDQTRTDSTAWKGVAV